MSIFEREVMVIGEENLNKIQSKHFLIFGAGGVGSACIEALARAGALNIDIVDGDTVSLSNKNRQLIALDSTIGKPKAEVMKSRLLDINSRINVRAINIFYDCNTYSQIDLADYDYVIDCIDTITSKIHIIEECTKLGISLICATGTGNRLDPTQFYVTDIYKTINDPLCRVLRCELKKRRIKKLTVLASHEVPIKIPESLKQQDPESKRNIPGSISFVPPVAGMIIASYVINSIIKKEN